MVNANESTYKCLNAREDSCMNILSIDTKLVEFTVPVTQFSSRIGVLFTALEA